MMIDRQRGFTLLEMMVAMTILVFLVSFLALMSGQMQSFYLSGVAHDERRSQGRALIQVIARELQMASIPPSGPMFAAGPGVQFIASVPTAAATTTDPTGVASAYMNPHAIFWQAPIAADQTMGNLAIVGYFVQWSSAKAQLCRLYVPPSDTTNYLLYSLSAGNPQNWLSVIPTAAPATAAKNYKGWFADNVISFWARCLDSTGQPISQTAAGVKIDGGYGFDSRQGYIDSANVIHPAPALPPFVEIALVTIDQATASRLTASVAATTTTPDKFWTDITTFTGSLPANVQAGAEVYSTRVPLINAH